jgi:transposase-like protein
MPGRNHSREFKLECCRQIASGQKRPAQVCREYNLAESLLARWRKGYEARGEDAFGEEQISETAALEARIAELERFCGKLALENEILRKASRTVMSRNGTH